MNIKIEVARILNGGPSTLDDKVLTKCFKRLLNIGTYKLTERELKEGVISLRCLFHFWPKFELIFIAILCIHFHGKTYFWWWIVQSLRNLPRKICMSRLCRYNVDFEKYFLCHLHLMIWHTRLCQAKNEIAIRNEWRICEEHLYFLFRSRAS